MTKIDLRRGDFEAMHPKAKLFGFDEDKKLYTGDGVESINDQWTTWCACIGMLHLGGKEAQAVPAQLDVNSILHDIDCYFDNGLSNTERTANNLLQSIYEKLSGEVKAQEPAND